MRGVSRPRPKNLAAPTQVRLPPELQARIDAYAARAGITRSQAIRALIEAGLAGQG
ncbi:ribbon-helix-helix protein, CopG family [Phenylobacterium kunshanense]|uniref:Ribbon-helix-helix protein CopG domain-containing protein n=1 Tax=Phenylobacterium kunshanense TaxID=1445034 RepID=A0A328BSA3_9CAUL|nr:hypothetical protein DJ019_02405 [Phenylobacterium kunshanense]